MVNILVPEEVTVQVLGWVVPVLDVAFACEHPVSLEFTRPNRGAAVADLVGEAQIGVTAPIPPSGNGVQITVPAGVHEMDVCLSISMS